MKAAQFLSARWFVLLLALGALTTSASDFSGKVSDDGSGISGVRINYTWKSLFSSGSGSVNSGSGGSWKSTGWGGSTTVKFTPSQSGYSFSPSSRTVSSDFFANNDIKNLNFERISYYISGRVVRSGVPVAGVTVSLTGAASRTAVTGAAGTYSFTRLPTGNYTVRVALEGHSFSLAARSTSLGGSKSGQDFELITPVATTLPADVSRIGEATLNGTVAGAAGEATRAWFEFGPVDDFSSATPGLTLPAGPELVPVAIQATNLTPGVNYNFRLVAANDNGTNRGAALFFAVAYPSAGTALHFDGVNDYVQVGNNPALKVSSNLTVEAWINPVLPAAGYDTDTILVNREGEYELARFADGTLRYAIANASPGWTWISTGVVAPHNTWMHFAFVYEAGASADPIRFYTNGVLAYSRAGSGPIGDRTTSQNDFRIGSRQGGGMFFSGDMDEVRVWGVARTDAQVAADYARRLVGTPEGLLAHYHFDDTGDGKTPDAGPNGLTGVLVGGPQFVESGAILREPVAITRAPTPIGAIRATLNGTVNPAGSSTTVYFEYGPTIAYGTRVFSGPYNDLAAIPISTVITNLDPGTTYHYRLVAYNTYGTNIGSDEMFNTLVLGYGWPIATKVTGGQAFQPKHVLDVEGNAYVSGLFTGSATFTGTLMPSGGSETNAFLGKLARGSDWLFATNIPSSGSVIIRALAPDGGKGVVVVGEFSGNATFGGTTLTASGGTDAFIARYGDTNGWSWAKKVGSTSTDVAMTVALDSSGNIFVGGRFSGSVAFGGTTLVSQGGMDAFVGKLDSAGNWLWAERAGGGGALDSVDALAVGPTGDVFAAGQFQGTANFGSANYTSAGSSDLFIARLSGAGQWLLARRGGGAGTDVATALTIDRDGRVYLLGTFAGTADYDTRWSNLNVGFEARIFFMQLDANANLLRYAQAGNGFADSIAVDRSERVYISGDFTLTTSFGEPPGLTRFSAGNEDVFLARYDLRAGAWDWSQSIGSTGSEQRGSISLDGNGDIVVSGTFQSTVQIGYVLLTSPNERDIFVARLTPDLVFKHNDYIIGEALPVPEEAKDFNYDDGAIGQPEITILEKDQNDTDAVNAFIWSAPEHKLFALRPVTAIIKWPLSANLTNNSSVATVVGRSRYPDTPQFHVAGVSAELEPAVAGFPLKFVNLAFTTINDASVDASTKLFTASQSGWTVLQFLDSQGEAPNPLVHPSVFQVVRTLPWNDATLLDDNVPAPIGTAITRSTHRDPTGKNGYVFFEKAFYDGAGEDAAYRRATRTGPIIPVNRDTPAANDDLVVVWFHTNRVTGIAWPDDPVRYLATWPTNPTNVLVIASGEGSGLLDPALYPQKRLYNQPDKTLPGFNPNEEHAALYGDTLFALRDDLNSVLNVSEPFSLLKYRDPATGQWTMRVYKVVAEDDDHRFQYTADAGQELLAPRPLSLMTVCTDSGGISGPYYEDYNGKIYARAAGSGAAGTNVVVRWSYPLQPGFFYDLDQDGVQDVPVSTCLPLLGKRYGDRAVDMVYSIEWPADAPTLQIGETLLNAKLGLPSITDFASARVVYDQSNPRDTNALGSLVRLFDPISERKLSLGVDFVLPPDILTANSAGRIVFPDLPYHLRSRLFYDPLNKTLSFGGLLNEDISYGGPDNPLLLINVMSPREAARIKQLSGDTEFGTAIDRLYDLTRNPNQLDLDRNGQADTNLLVGLAYSFTTNTANGAISTNVVHERLPAGPKCLTAGPGTGSGYVVIAENDDASLAGLPVSLHVIQIGDGPFRGDIKVLYPDNVFDEKLTLRHSGDFGGEPQRLEFEWYYQPDDPGFSRTNLPSVATDGSIDALNGWIKMSGVPAGVNGYNDITIGDGSTSSLLTLADNWFVCRYRGYEVNGETNWSDWVGAIGGGEAQLAEGWVKRVILGLNPFEARTKAFHESEAVIFASMLQQAGARYEGDIGFNPGAANLNSIGLIEAYQTVLNRARRLSIDGAPAVNFAPANNALLLAAGRIADFYMLLGNEAYADAADPTIGFRTDSAGYGTLAPSIFAFQNQLDSLLTEEVTLLRGRDDKSASVRAAPAYNRLFWNFTKGEGEVAYAQAYNITDQNGDGAITAEDARIMYPQGHGDAWGHYLTAIKGYYGLLQSPNFDWIPRTESILLAGVPVEVDYLDERKFARAAAAKAKTGAEIVDLTYRLNFVEDPEGQFQGYKDSNPDRAWGVSEWAERAGSGAFFDWVTANSILPAVDPDPTHTGIEKVDRTTVAEIAEIVAAYDSVQSQMDKVDGGLNPLGLAKNVVPFDIDPARISAGETHFEQIYERAIQAMDNAETVFNHANQLSQALRALQDSVNDFSRNVGEEERDYKNRMIEVFGYPYAGDIGAGKTYPSGYDGPDIYHYMYVGAVDISGQASIPAGNFDGFYSRLSGFAESAGHYFEDDFASLSNPEADPGGVLQVPYPLDAGGFAFSAPKTWGQRRAPGEIQTALSEVLQSQVRLKQAMINYDNLVARIDDAVDELEARERLGADVASIRRASSGTISTLRNTIKVAQFTQRNSQKIVDTVNDVVDAISEGIPKVVGLANDAFSGVRASLKTGKITSTQVAKALQFVATGVEQGATLAINNVQAQTASQVSAAQTQFEITPFLRQIEQMIREESPMRLEILALGEKVNQNVGRYQASVAKGLRLAEERVAFRKNASADTQASRYQDMTFRIFRNDAIQKYRAQFDLTAQYVYLAAVAYDYETQLLGGQTGSGQKFLTDIVRQRALGQIENGVPIAGRHGLADPLARLSQNFAVLKGQLGFNNPQTETGRFSLRNELFRLRNDSDVSWREELKRHVVADLWQVPEFRRYCRPFAPESAGPQPGLVIRFPTTVTFGLNYFGWPLGGGDSAYDSSLFATKVRSAGVWFNDYNGAGLSVTPRVYLIPAGADIVRSPSSFDLAVREWRVVDQKIPVPFPIGVSSLNNDSWIPMNDSLSDTFADIRKFSSFRAYHDSGAFSPMETVSDSRLIGRSVWNTDWVLIIPGGTFLFDADEGLDAFIDSVGDIKIFFQTYAYSGN
jgi:hypothetical protein